MLKRVIEPTIAVYKDKKLVEKLISTLPYSTSFLKYNNRLRTPFLSNRQVKELQRAAVYHGITLPEKIRLYEKPENKYSKHGFIKSFKIRRDERRHDEDVEKIAEALRTMRPKMEKLRADERDRRYRDMFDLGLFGKGPLKTGRGSEYMFLGGKKKKDTLGKKKKK
jgi:hypothetical protein